MRSVARHWRRNWSRSARCDRYRGSIAAALAAKRQPRTIPIVFQVADPVRLVRREPSSAGRQRRPASISFDRIGGKWLELLREMVPAATRVAVLVNAANARKRDVRETIEAAGAVRWGASPSLKCRLHAARSIAPSRPSRERPNGACRAATRRRSHRVQFARWRPVTVARGLLVA